MKLFIHPGDMRCVLIKVEGYLGVSSNLRTSIRSDHSFVLSFSVMESRELRIGQVIPLLA